MTSKKLFLAEPLHYSFKVDPGFHTVNVADKWRDCVDCCMYGNVKGVIGYNAGDVKRQLFDNVRKYFMCLPDLADGRIRLTDFSFAFKISAADADGNVWTGGGVCSHAGGKDLV